MLVQLVDDTDAMEVERVIELEARNVRSELLGYGEEFCLVCKAVERDDNGIVHCSSS